MIFHADADRLARSRFALSRLVELTNGLEVLVHPERAPYARGWIERTRHRLDPSGIPVLWALVDHASWYVPDFIVPVPDIYAPSMEQELAAVAAMPEPLVRHQLEMAFQIGSPPAAAAERSRAGSGADPRAPLPRAIADLLSSGGEGALIACVADQLRRCWTVVLEESWPSVQRILDQDVRDRAALASRVGFAEIIGGLHPALAWDGSQVNLDAPYDVSVAASPGLVLTPSAFLHRPAVWLGLPGQVMIGYPARGRGQVWAVADPAGQQSELLGVRRAALLADLVTPRSTTELARRHGLSPATVSYHLGRLHQAGLVARRQDGHSVMYERTGRASGLLAALATDRPD